MDTSDFFYSDFEQKVSKTFAFLDDLNFSQVEASPTLVRYRKGNVEVDIYQGRQSYEIGAGITISGTRYALSEIIRVSDKEKAQQLHYVSTKEPEGVISALEELSSLIKRYGRLALEGDAQFLSLLDCQRKTWSEEYALDVLAEQLRPKAEEAFRRKDYSTAADLYSQIRERLSQAEIKKLSFAEKQRKT